MLPSAPTANVSTFSTEPSVSSICCCVVIVKSSSPCRAIRMRRTLSTTSATLHAFLVMELHLEHAVAIEQLERLRGRDEHGVVEIEAERRALRPHDARDAIALAADP